MLLHTQWNKPTVLRTSLFYYIHKIDSYLCMLMYSHQYANNLSMEVLQCTCYHNHLLKDAQCQS